MHVSAFPVTDCSFLLRFFFTFPSICLLINLKHYLFVLPSLNLSFFYYYPQFCQCEKIFFVKFFSFLLPLCKFQALLTFLCWKKTCRLSGSNCRPLYQQSMPITTTQWLYLSVCKTDCICILKMSEIKKKKKKNSSTCCFLFILQKQASCCF